MDETRKAFEAWAQGCGWDISKIGSGEGWDGTYISAAVRFMWEAWQAADEIERLRAELAAAQQQAAAYRFIRAGNAHIEPEEDGAIYVSADDCCYCDTPEEFDAAIFAAMENDNG